MGVDKQNLRCVARRRGAFRGERLREQSKARLERPGKPKDWCAGVGGRGSRLGERHRTGHARTAATGRSSRLAFGFRISRHGRRRILRLMEFFARDVRQPDERNPGAQNVSAHIGQFIARKQAERNLQFVASHDALTGLFNRSMFSQRLQQALAQAHRHERQLAVLFIDLDGFKLINDMLGHDAGDVLLADLAVRLRECMREGDTWTRGATNSGC